MGVEIIESEYHFLFECDMYAKLREKLITRLNEKPLLNIPSSSNTQYHATQITLYKDSLAQNLMTLLSPHTTNNINSTEVNHSNIHHRLASDISTNKHSQDKDNIVQHHSYIVNCVCSYISNAFKKRLKYMKSIKENKNLPTVITINF